MPFQKTGDGIKPLEVTLTGGGGIPGPPGPPGPAGPTGIDGPPGPGSNVYYFVDAGISINSDPTRNEVAAGATATDSAQFTVMYVEDITINVAIALTSAFLTCDWSTETTVGVGGSETKWMLSTGSETLGLAPSGSAIEVITAVTSGPEYQVHRLSGVVKRSALPTGPFKLVLVGKPTSPGDTITATVFDESAVEYTF